MEEEKWIPRDNPPNQYNPKSGFEQVVLYRLGEIEKRLAHYEENTAKMWDRVHLLEVAHGQIKILAVAASTLMGVITMIVSRVWKG